MKIPKQYSIKWKQTDYLTLGKAVAQFNKKINRLNAEEVKNYLPELKDYSEIKKNITSRNELNRIIRSLKRFSREGAEELYKTQAGEELTRWERKELGIQKGIAKKRLTRELNQLNTSSIDGFSRVQMGSIERKQIEQQLKNLETLENKRGYEFDRIVRRINVIGTSDYNLRKAYIYQDNFMIELEELKENSPEFNKVYEYFKNIKNPTSFFNTAQKSSALQDFFVWYKEPEGYAGFETKEELVDFILSEYSN